ncbi:hypothetical protein [Ornithinimicrobium kibberense]|uniref:hypothetical protein n=1 Tax=Ornithinimicrobium kibberense TaxID=282060 RepID=UPI0036139F1B
MLRGALSEASGRPPGFLDLARMRVPGSFRTCDTRFRRATLARMRRPPRRVLPAQRLRTCGQQ